MMASPEPTPTRSAVDPDSPLAPHAEGVSQPTQPSPAGSAEPEPGRRKLHGEQVAAFLGAVAGGVAFLLVALFLGPIIGALTGLVAAFLARHSRRTSALVAFAAAGLLSALAIWLPLTVQLFAAVAFATGLLLGVRARPVA
ncbi:MAG TPA: hypothetical protein VJ596_09415 [Gemmatimonadaceae bacterium]|nr:hypothetical protein [Gemmatimonadaceae bacterium]